MTDDYGRLKDFVKPFLSGTLGAGLTLLQMGQAGYPWMAHWEDCGGPTAGAHPDFVFFRDATAHASAAVCLVESKGSRGASTDADAQADWARQIWPNRHQRLTLPGGSHVLPTEGRLVANELPGPDGRKRFRSTLVHGVFPGGLPTVAPAPAALPPGRGGGAMASAPNPPRLDADNPAIDWWGVQRANLRHVCRLLDLPVAEAALAASFYDDSHGDMESALQAQLVRALDELDGRRAELDWGPLRSRDVVCTGRPQSVVRPDGTRWEVTMYCQYEVLWTVLMGYVATAKDGAERLEMPWGEPGQQRVRLQGADGVGLMVRQRPAEARVG